MSALTGVGPSIASGSHVCSGICADFATAPPSRPSATRLTAVDEKWQADADVAGGEARPGGRDLTVVPRLSAHAEKGPDRAAEGDEHAGSRNPGGGVPRQPRSAEQDEDRADKRREQAEPGTAG